MAGTIKELPGHAPKIEKEPGEKNGFLVYLRTYAGIIILASFLFSVVFASIVSLNEIESKTRIDKSRATLSSLQFLVTAVNPAGQAAETDTSAYYRALFETAENGALSFRPRFKGCQVIATENHV